MTGPTAARVDVVWCDFGGVLTPPVALAAAAVEAATGVPWATLATAADTIAAAWGLRGLGPLERGLASQADWGAAVERALPAGAAPRHPLADFGTAWYAGRGPADPEMLDVLRDARARGCRIGMLTNSVLEWEPLRAVMLTGAEDVFDVVVRSHEIGVAKPDAEIFELADGLLPPARGAVLIDDVSANAAAARAHGWHAVHHIDATTTARELHALLGEHAT